MSQTPLSPFLLLCDALATEHDQLCIVAENAHQAQWVWELISQRRQDVYLFPDWEILPYDTLIPAADIAVERARTLYQLRTQAHWVVITSPLAVGYRLPPPSFYQQRCWQLSVGQNLIPQDLIEELTAQGYQRVDEVHEPKEFAVRGSIIDFYPPFQAQALRLEWDHHTLEQIRSFDTSTQLTQSRHQRLDLFPAFEYPTDPKTLQKCAQKASERWGTKNPATRALKEGKVPPGFLFLSPLWMGEQQPTHFYDYLPSDAFLYEHPGLPKALEELSAKALSAHQEATWRYGFEPCTPAEILAPSCARQAQTVSASLHHWDLWPLEQDDPWKQLKQVLQEKSLRVLITFESTARAQILSPKIEAITGEPLPLLPSWDAARKSPQQTVSCVAPFQEALKNSDESLLLVSEAWLYQESVRVRARRSMPAVRRSRPSLELTTGALVIHRDHGLARYQGLKTLKFENLEQELIELEFAAGQKLYVPVPDIARLTPYYALEQQEVTLASLGNSRWKKQVQRAQKAAEDQAAALLEIHAMRARSQGDPWTLDPSYHEFCASFPFDETLDQQQAIDHVLADLQSSRPMDRLICGDVGFGKTEVALRAIFAALAAGYQVAFLAPTTLLSQQHFETLLERFAPWPFVVSLLTRHTSKAKDVLEKLKSGQIDCVVGTHKLLQPQVRFKRLGLVIVDEEHRFGVTHKEALKKWRGAVNILSMTATPIPRTLSMAFQGLRDLSIIGTPPAQRRSIHTVMQQYSPQIVQRAIERELFRSGQVYYLCNDIDKHPAKVAQLQELIPQARVESLHGGLREQEMERRMNQFYHQRLDILVCTTIVETGIDVPNANTMLIEDAHCFGLSQLHQIRGRVGRSHHQAYAYLMTPGHENTLSRVARSRLELLTLHQDLGSGFQLATHDLEIRGAGEILGDKQSGHILELGIDLYRQILEEACRNLEQHSEAEQKEKNHYQVDWPFSLDPAQIPDPSMRLKLYHEWEQISDLESWAQRKDAFCDRFGSLSPRSADWIESHRWRILAQLWSWPYLQWKKRCPLIIEFAPLATEGSCCEKNIERLIAAHARFVKILSPRRVSIEIPQPHMQRPAEILKNLFDRLSGETQSDNVLWSTPD